MECPFCGSKEIRIKTPYVKATGTGNDDFEPITTWCCTAQRTNQAYIKKNFHPDDAPSEEDVSKL